MIWTAWKNRKHNHSGVVYSMGSGFRVQIVTSTSNGLGKRCHETTQKAQRHQGQHLLCILVRMLRAEKQGNWRVVKRGKTRAVAKRKATSL
jgi:hypothetical protein